MKTIIDRIIFDKKEDNRIPILRGCMAAQHGGCFCTGRCNEIIGYKSADGSETTYLKCHHGKLLSGFGCQECETEKQKKFKLLNEYVHEQKKFKLLNEYVHEQKDTK